MEQPLGETAEQSHQGEGHRQVSRDDAGRQQVQHGESTEPTLSATRSTTHRQCWEPCRERRLQDSDNGHHKQGDADNERVKAMKPLQKDLVFIDDRQQGAEAQGQSDRPDRLPSRASLHR